MDSNLDSKSIDPAVPTENIASEKSAEKSASTDSSFSHNIDTKAALPAEVSTLSDSISASIESLGGPSSTANETHILADNKLIDPSSIVEEQVEEEQLQKVGVEASANDPDTSVVESGSAPVTDPPSESVVELPNLDVKTHAASPTAVEIEENHASHEALNTGESVVELSIDEVVTKKIIEKSGVEREENSPAKAETESTETHTEAVTETPQLDTSMEQLSQESVVNDVSVVIEPARTENINTTSIELTTSVEESPIDGVLDENVRISVLDVNEGVEVQKVDETPVETNEASSVEQRQNDPTSANETGTPEAVASDFVKNTVSDEQSETTVADVSDASKEPTLSTLTKGEVAEPNEETLAGNESAEKSEPGHEISLPDATLNAPANDASLTVERQPDVLSAKDFSNVEAIAQEANGSVIEDSVDDAEEVEDFTEIAEGQEVEEAVENNDDASPVETPQQDSPTGESSNQKSAVEPVDVPVTEGKVEAVVEAVTDAAQDPIVEVAMTKEDTSTMEPQPEADSAEESNPADTIVLLSTEDAAVEEQVETIVEAVAEVAEKQDVEVALTNEKASNASPTKEPQPSTVSDENPDTPEQAVKGTVTESVSENQDETLVEAVTEVNEEQTVDEVSVTKVEDSPTEVLDIDAVSAEQPNSTESIVEQAVPEPVSEEPDATPVDGVTDIAEDEPVLDEKSSQDEISQSDPVVAEVTHTPQPSVAESVDVAVSEGNVKSDVDVATEGAEQQLVDKHDSPTDEAKAEAHPVQEFSTSEIFAEASVAREVDSPAEEPPPEAVSAQESNTSEPIVEQPVDAAVSREQPEQTEDPVLEVAETQIVAEVTVTKE
ncbi:hypothetical protein BKA69DRAFT_1036658, partial [Paraphysoderma sedebokerense]